jgi:drug/metabolite transporter (DMT)-like permease
VGAFVSLLIALPAAAGAAVAYGVSTAVEHSAASSSASTEGPSGLLRLLRNPRWLAGMLGDGVGLLLQILALATGPVLLVQPILVLALPVSLPISWLLGSPRPGWREFWAVLAILVGLAVFFVLVGSPGEADPLRARPAVIAVLVVVITGVAALAAVRGQRGPVRAAVYGGVAGAWFGFVAVLMDATATTWRADGVAAFGRPAGLVPLVTLLILGAVSIALTQAAFQLGELTASFPANLTADPVLAVILGSLLLHENLPHSAGYVAAYLLCLAAIVAGSVRLAAS